MSGLKDVALGRDAFDAGANSGLFHELTLDEQARRLHEVQLRSRDAAYLRWPVR